VVEHISNFVAVMYLGNIVEYGPTEAIFAEPLHPYTKALFSAIPYPDPDAAAERLGRRTILSGSLPSPASPPSGCKFHTRCPYSAANTDAVCVEEAPALKAGDDAQHLCACHFSQG
jgi:peptide/nickel transport system ATP-binding protein